jgi:hypothetical protein
MAPDFRVFEVLARHGVPFLVIGGHAVSFHGYVRATEDTDIVWMRSPEAEKGSIRRRGSSAPTLSRHRSFARSR